MKLETPVDLLGPDTEESALKSNLRNIVRGMLLTYDCLLHPSFPTSKWLHTMCSLSPNKKKNPIIQMWHGRLILCIKIDHSERKWFGLCMLFSDSITAVYWEQCLANLLPASLGKGGNHCCISLPDPSRVPCGLTVSCTNCYAIFITQTWQPWQQLMFQLAGSNGVFPTFLYTRQE